MGRVKRSSKCLQLTTTVYTAESTRRASTRAAVSNASGCHHTNSGLCGDRSTASLATFGCSPNTSSNSSHCWGFDTASIPTFHAAFGRNASTEHCLCRDCSTASSSARHTTFATGTDTSHYTSTCDVRCITGLQRR